MIYAGADSMALLEDAIMSHSGCFTMDFYMNSFMACARMDLFVFCWPSHIASWVSCSSEAGQSGDIEQRKRLSRAYSTLLPD